MFDLRKSIVTEIETAGGRHDEPEIYGGEPGDPGIGGGPGSISWEINGDLASLVVGGTAAIIMEVLHPSVMAGVYTQSSYRTQPLQRGALTHTRRPPDDPGAGVQAQESLQVLRPRKHRLP